MHRWSFSSDRNLQGLPWLIAVFLVLFLIEPRVVFDGTGRASQHWGPAAYAQEDEDDDVDEETPTPDEIDNMADPGGLPSTVEDGETVRPVKKASAKKKTAKERAKPAAKATKKAVKRPKPKSSVKRAKAAPAKKTTTKPVRRPKKAVEESSAPETSEDEEPADDSESAYAEEDDGAEESREEAAPRDPVRANATARELAIRKVGLAQVTVTRSARRYVPKDMEKSLRETLIQDLNSRSYFSVAPLKGVARMTASDRALAGIQRKEGLEGVLVLQIGLEEIY
ncbi:MAG: hypothetical protein RBT63_11320, partial [Bdellovibrionales bacterium]|nr:hypothetical protein [Bdellovibrionales bacterium]